MAFHNLVVDDGAPVRTVTVNRPQVRNALDAATLDDLFHAFGAIEALPDATIRCVILTGAGDKAFAAGADIAAMADMGVADARALAGLGHRLGERMAGMAVPIIAAVNGFALGGGLELALACDFIIAARGAKLGQPEVSVGVLPGFGGTQRLPRRIGGARARQLLYTGELISAEQACAWGLVNEVVEPALLLPRARQIAESIAARAPLAVASAKRAVHSGEDLPLDRGLALEQELFAGLFGTADQKEGMQAFLAKRPPRWQGK